MSFARISFLSPICHVRSALDLLLRFIPGIPTSCSRMNTRQVIDESLGPYSLSAAFNNDSSCFSVGLNTGFCGMKCAVRWSCQRA